MADVVNVTPQPVTVTGIQKQNLWEAADVGNYDMLDLFLGVVGGSATPAALQVSLITGMQKQQEDASWLSLPTDFGAVSSALPNWQRVTFNMGFGKYVRWNVSNMGGLSSVTFVIRGIGRRYGA